ncbi:unnamed protein product [Prunus brigantina]
MAHSTNSNAAPLPPLSSSSSPNFYANSPLLNSVSSVTVQNIAGMVPIKLKYGNYLLWKNLFLLVLRKFRLLGLINDAEPFPPRTIVSSSGIVVANPQFDLWYERDQSLMI